MPWTQKKGPRGGDPLGPSLMLLFGDQAAVDEPVDAVSDLAMAAWMAARWSLSRYRWAAWCTVLQPLPR